jgi:hypothetical protein
MGKGAKKSEDVDKPLDIGEIKTEFALELRKAVQSIRQRFKTTPDSSEAFNTLISDIDHFLKEKKPTENHHKLKISARQALAHLKELQGGGLAGDPLALCEMKSEIEEGLVRAYAREAYTWFSTELTKLRTDVIVKRDAAHNIELVQKQKAVAAPHYYDWWCYC